MPLPKHKGYPEDYLRTVRSDPMYLAALNHLYHDNPAQLSSLLKENGMEAVENYLINLYQKAVNVWDRKVNEETMSQQEADEYVLKTILTPPEDLTERQEENYQLSPGETYTVEEYLAELEKIED